MKNIKSYKLFLESLNDTLYKDDEYILHGLFTPLFDKYFVIRVERGWIDEQNQFRIMPPGKNRRLGYSVVLSGGREKYTQEDIQDCISNIEFDDMKVIKQKGLTFIIDALKTSDITIEDVVKEELNFITMEQYLEGDAFIKENLKNSTTKSDTKYKVWINQDKKWIIEQDLKNDWFFLQYYIIWSFFQSKFGINYQQIQQFTKILLESNLNLRVTITKEKAWSRLLLLENNLNWESTKEWCPQQKTFIQKNP